MLRQQSEASMRSTGTSKSNDSSWAGNNNDLPEDYQASFMQLNLADLDQTHIQTNDEVLSGFKPRRDFLLLVESNTKASKLVREVVALDDCGVVGQRGRCHVTSMGQLAAKWFDKFSLLFAGQCRYAGERKAV